MCGRVQASLRWARSARKAIDLPVGRGGDQGCARGAQAGVTLGRLRADFGTADFRKNGIVIFNVGGNKYRLVAHFRYDIGFVYIKHVVTHTEYDRLKL